MSTLGICLFSLLKTSLAALICADGRIFFSPVCHSVMPDQEHGFCPGQGHGDEAQGNATSLVGSPVRRMNSLPPSSTAASSCFPRPRAEHSWGQTKGIGQELHLAHGVEKDRGAAVVCSTNVEEYALIHHVPGQRSHANVFKLDREHDAGT